MFKHILLPSDGSPLAQRGVKTGIGFARSLGARVTVLHVVPPYVPPFDAFGYLAVTATDHRKACARTAKAILSRAAAHARKAGVACSTLSVTDLQPWGGILRAARARHCDAIVIASHGRGAVGGLLLGSETQRVLARARIPVLVTR